jgi:hypothetical protein
MPLRRVRAHRLAMRRRPDKPPPRPLCAGRGRWRPIRIWDNCEMSYTVREQASGQAASH